VEEGLSGLAGAVVVAVMRWGGVVNCFAWVPFSSTVVGVGSLTGCSSSSVSCWISCSVSGFDGVGSVGGVWVEGDAGDTGGWISLQSAAY
jgi:hypothetical protein